MNGSGEKRVEAAHKPRYDQRFVRRFVRMFRCDTARVSCPLGKTMYLIIGHKRENKEEVWVDQDGNEKHFEYLEEKTVASGDTEAELIASAKKYKRLSKMTWPEYFRQEHGIHFPSNANINLPPLLRSGLIFCYTCGIG